jgi:hypothetical protein
VTSRSTEVQLDLLPTRTAAPLPPAVEAEAHALLVQWLEALIPAIEREVRNEQDRG